MPLNLLSKKCALPQKIYRVIPSQEFYNPITQLYDWEKARETQNGYTSTLCGSSSSDVYGSCNDDKASDDVGGGDW